MKNNNYHIIYLIGFSPKFAYLKNNKSLFRAAKIWKNNKGQKIGIWSEDWGNQLGAEFKKKYPDINYEVWRPDIRADKIYKYKFENGVINKSFPVNKGISMSGIRPIIDVFSKKMEYELLKYSDNKRKVIFIMPAIRKKITLRFNKKFNKSVNIINSHFLNCSVFTKESIYSKNPIRFFHNYIKYKQQYHFTKTFDKLVVGHNKYINILQKNISGKIYFNTFGSNLDFWMKEKAKDKLLLRNELKIPKDFKVFLLSSRLIKEYQILEVLELISNLKKYKIYFIFTSQGDNAYILKIKNSINKFNLDNYVNFTGYVDEKKLRDLYKVSDYFFMSSIYNAGPMSSFIAILMNIPIITTNSGLAAEILKDNSCGLILETNNVVNWIVEFEKIINNKIVVSKLDRKHVIKLFDWSNIVDKWIDIFDDNSVNISNSKLGEIK